VLTASLDGKVRLWREQVARLFPPWSHLSPASSPRASRAPAVVAAAALSTGVQMRGGPWVVASEAEIGEPVSSMVTSPAPPPSY